jgi:hypothetical protein
MEKLDNLIRKFVYASPKQTLITLVTIAGITLVSASIPITIYREHNEAYTMASQAISKLDGEPGTSDKDWAIAYKKVLDKNYDFNTSSPFLGLSNDELNNIANTYK